MDPTTINALGLEQAHVIYLTWTHVARAYQVDSVTAEALVSTCEIALSQPDVEPLDTGCLLWKPMQGPCGMYEARRYVPVDGPNRGPRTLHTPDFLEAVQFAAHSSRGAVVPPSEDDEDAPSYHGSEAHLIALARGETTLGYEEWIAAAAHTRESQP